MKVPREVERTWREVAERVGGTYTSPSGLPVVQVRRGDWILTLDRPTAGSQVITRLRAPFHNPDRVRLRIRREGVMDDLWKRLGFITEPEIDDRSFDSRFLVTGHPHERIRAILARDEIRTLVQAQPKIDLRIMGRTLDPSFPPGIDQLYAVDRRWRGLAAEELSRLFELFLELLPLLSTATRQADPPGLVQRLRGPGGTVRGWGGVVLWDGDTPRRVAADRLGVAGDDEAADALLGALDDPDEELVATAAHALARRGEARAVEHLLRMLGQRGRQAGRKSLAEHAARALETLGRGEEAEAFHRALHGEPGALSRLQGPYREAVVAALMDIVDSSDFAVRNDAARALGAMGANEALPLLRDKSSAMGMRTSLTEAAAEAVAAIEARASLPRPASGSAPDRRDTRPRPAEDRGADPGRLPRPADRGPGEDTA